MSTYIGCIIPQSEFISQVLEKYTPKGYILVSTQTDLKKHADKIEYLVVFSSLLSASDIEPYKNLKFIQLLSAGFDNIDTKNILARNVQIAHNIGLNSTAVAEHTILLLLALLKRLPALHTNMQLGKWQTPPPDLTDYVELEGKVVGIVGFGRIGQKVATRLLGFGVRVQYFDIRKIPKEEFFNKRVKKSSLENMFKTSDIISFHVPLTNATYHMVTTSTIKKMKKNVFLVNTSRGSVIDQSSLVKALEQKKIGGAALDVFEQEPLRDNPFKQFTNVVLTPHRAGSTYENWHARVAFAFKNIQRFQKKEKPWGLL